MAEGLIFSLMKIEHSKLIDSLRKAYSAEKAASYAYIGHAGSLRDGDEKLSVKQIEDDEWEHRANVLKIMDQYDIPVSRWYEIKFAIIGRVIGMSCYFIGRFMPYFFAGKLESGNVCEYFVMMKYFESLEIRDHHEMLFEMGIKEKEHEVYFLSLIKDAKWLPVFEKVFSWGVSKSMNDLDLDHQIQVEEALSYCNKQKTEQAGE